jgi:hypothetical protein
MAVKYTKWTSDLPNGRKIYHHLQLQDPPRFTQIWIFGLKRYHLATLDGRSNFITKTISLLLIAPLKLIGLWRVS